MGIYRGRLDIIADILHVVGENARKTRIMYQANLSYRVLQRYLAQILEASLASFECEKRCYVLTAKGRVFLEAYREYSEINRRVEKGLASVRSKSKVLEELVSSK